MVIVTGAAVCALARVAANPTARASKPGRITINGTAILRIRDGQIVGREPLGAARARHQAALAELPGYARQLSRGYPAIPTVFEPSTLGVPGMPD